MKKERERGYPSNNVLIFSIGMIVVGIILIVLGLFI